MTRIVFALTLLSLATSSAESAQEMIQNGSFNQGTDGWWFTGADVATKNGEACVTITHPGANPWNVILGHSGIGLAHGEGYQVSFDAFASAPTQFKALIQHQGPPYTHHFVNDTQLSTSKQRFEFSFTQQGDSDAAAEFQFQMGAQKPATICVSDVSVNGTPYRETFTTNVIRQNQLGFLPKADKFIYLQSDSVEPQRWVLQTADGINIDMGRSVPIGKNRASGENLHQIDLSTYTSPMKGLTVKVGEATSYPFDIRDDIYSQLKYDALSYFYQNRSGIEIETKYVQREDLARPAGHSKDVASCFDKTDEWGNRWPGCDFSIDATGGWYDAGDHGKYTVNSGISTWTLLNLYERGHHLGGNGAPFQTGVKIPEMDSDVNPLLSEARWNIEFMLAMQIPEGKQVAVPIGDQSGSKKLTLEKHDVSYMAFHKIADGEWTGMPLPPHKSQQKRYVGHPTTAATLNLAAIGAQCARIWQSIDDAFANRCLTAATRAWDAALKQPQIYAYNNFTGSGPYDDKRLSDEWYWAATELFISTGEDKYLSVVNQSKHYLETPNGDLATPGDMYWQYVAPLATISLAVVPSKLGEDVQTQARSKVIDTAKYYQAQVAKEGYRIPYSVEQYPWGSNSNVANRGIFLVYASDFTGELSFIKAAASGMDYLLGANPMSISYVTGYGENSAQNPHHRFWAHAADAQSPMPAPGALVGGPNSINYSDSVAARLKGNCVGQTCYRDDISAWTLNEITINWNAPLVWLASALDEGQLN
ncbi:glycoside hydrolase family 9 protein [Vibrio sp. SCSIO 43136]|uniref:glycoside hydrolase family 9 protein n=1 Tax=Vibrio sp. SCSIO 43136 TaxID=2819101 RepID=UPI00207504D4|nr:glycoside hydrolase family 9 protein [Vibrio sp. SCSIO 43136]USD67336.1 glycoside hydrolase family 9 protein [Vibrio sp. SCSIO 43136]